ncbi:MAG TPA: hypothetical protein VGX03_38080 [Candidatus Binatia bacterium]|jgi:hypothetical protein|nr:hypothetical protein [Candidatus Binatia bacterium]
MASEKLAVLLSQIHRQTQDGILGWEATIRGEVFQVAFPNYVVQIAKEARLGPDEEEVTEYVLKILNERNAVIEEITSSDLYENLRDPYGLMSEIYASARRQALGPDRALDNLLQALERNERDVEVEKHAKEKGYVKITCGHCKGRGKAERADANSPTGKVIENPCSSCKGSGRLWAYGAPNSTYQLDDDQLMKQ